MKRWATCKYPGCCRAIVHDAPWWAPWRKGWRHPYSTVGHAAEPLSQPWPTNQGRYILPPGYEEGHD